MRRSYPPRVAGGVSGRNDDLGADQADPFKCEAGRQSRGASSEAVSALRRANPISGVAEMVKGIDLVETAPAKKRMVVGVDDRKTKISAVHPTRLNDSDPIRVSLRS